MDLGEILRVLRSRWYIVVPMLLLAAGLGAGVYAAVPTTYTTYTMVSLLSAPAATTAATQGQDNPFLNFNGSLVATADFLGRRLQSTDTQLELKTAGLTEKYEVALAENAQGPFLTLTLTGADRDHLLASANQLAEYAGKTLADIQKQNDVAEKDRIKLTQVIPPQKPQPLTKEKLKYVIVAGGGTAALGLVLAFVVESIARSRRRKALAGAGDAEPATATGAATATPDIEGTMVLHLPPKAPAAAAPRQPVSPSEAKTQVIRAPQRPASQGDAPSTGGASRSGPASTYQSNGMERRGQDAGRINGS
ncbi:Wzz/FepE/Etk N-terminal domain-containing protein [Actinoplanes teichomyceticus]|uniref:Subunit length determinant protein n=1 Tax=Actinoplanes teichomyceticus TaxID=1867 RepID=A0A561VL91_ACTTI|nr:Wzz/FepE/Etk N-terminal domain-containing protein [Actinoplanes teichomyceticus]TWG12389.1 subunit length determinant protein [Actinoplanes teichomyceticus]GIF13749.1 hypothetical protein Ate01nite_37810 [Actinoplanes teichomyceticus]